jgi:hypothetical protein
MAETSLTDKIGTEIQQLEDPDTHNYLLIAQS